MFLMVGLKNHPCNSARSLAVEICVMSAGRYCHVHHYKIPAVFFDTLGYRGTHREVDGPLGNCTADLPLPHVFFCLPSVYVLCPHLGGKLSCH